MATYSSSTSSSTSTPVQTPQSAFALAVSQAAEAVGEDQFALAQQIYQSTSVLTDQVVNNFLTASQEGVNLAGEQIQQYTNTTVPEMNQLATLAGTYNSNARIGENMGAAESNTEQATDAARQNSLQQLEAFGVDPSSGMYGELTDAQNTAAGAAAAGAGQTAELNTQNTGRQLLNESITAGEQLPGDTVNDLNAAYAGLTGAENSALSNANTQATLTSAAAPFFNAARNPENPPLSTQQHSTSVSGGGGGSGGGGSKPPQMPNAAPNLTPAKYVSPFAQNQAFANATALKHGMSTSSVGDSGAQGVQGNVSDQVTDPAFAQPGETFGPNGTSSEPDPSGFQPNNFSEFGGGSAANDGFGGNTSLGNDPFQGVGNPNSMQNYTGPQSDPFNPGATTNFGGTNVNSNNSGFGSIGSEAGFGQNFSGGNFGDPGGIQGGNFSDPGSAEANFGGNQYSDPEGGFGDPNGGFGSGASDPFQGNLYSDPEGGQGDPNGGFGSGASYSSGGGGYYGPAAGGAIPIPRYANGGMTSPTTGGHVPYSASPSHGQQIDDINSRLNAGEFVIPRDVAMWKGQEFFQKMIQQARQAVASAPAKPSRGNPPPGGPIRFRSQAAGR